LPRRLPHADVLGIVRRGGYLQDTTLFATMGAPDAVRRYATLALLNSIRANSRR
jgi:hypothetical protein